jgi:hypothetical protein
MVYDVGRQQSVVFGGKNYRYRPLGHTQTIVDDKVVRLATEGPAPRHSLGLTCDARRERVMLYGGKAYQGELQVALSDLWSWDGERWQILDG